LRRAREIIRIKALRNKKSEQDYLETQASLLPRQLPRFEIFTSTRSTHLRYVGGDFYDFVQLTSGEWVGFWRMFQGRDVCGMLSSMVLGALSMEFRSSTEQPEIANRMASCSAKSLFPTSS
jgi:serine phosphatase RsbU (regulator of sigma subunit)